MKVDPHIIEDIKEVLNGATIDGYYFTGSSFYIFFDYYETKYSFTSICIGFTGDAFCYQSNHRVDRTLIEDSFFNLRKEFISSVYDLYGFKIDDVRIENNSMILIIEEWKIEIISDKDDSWAIYPNRLKICDDDWIFSYTPQDGVHRK